MARPLVTVLIDTYNHERFIEEAIASVLAQDFPASEMEILVVDDGSTDRTPEIVQKFAPRVRYLRKENGGQASAFNFGIPQAQGEIVAFLDGDDWWAPNKLSCVTQAMAADSSVGIVGHGIIVVQADEPGRPEILREGFRFHANTIEGARLISRRGSFLGTSRMTIRSTLLRFVGPVPDAITVQADEFLSTLAAVLSAVQILPEPLTYYRLHDSNAFQLMTIDPWRLRRKYEALAALARCLDERLGERGVDGRVIRIITGRLHADVDQLRLLQDGGWPWETLKTEWKIYRVAHPDAPFSHRVFKVFTLLAALALPPRTYYGVRTKLAHNGLYRRARKRWLPIPEMEHIQKGWHTD